MDWRGGSLGKGRNHRWLQISGLSYHVGGGPFRKQGKLGEEQVWPVLAVPGLTAWGSWFQARKMEAPAFPVGATGKNVEKIGPEEGAHVATERGRSQGHNIIVTTANTVPSPVLYGRPVKFSQRGHPFSIPHLRPSYPHSLLYFPSERLAPPELTCSTSLLSASPVSLQTVSSGTVKTVCLVQWRYVQCLE